MIERGWADIGGDASDRRYRDVGEADERLKTIDARRGGALVADLGDGAGELELDCGERLSKLIVKFTRQPLPLLLARCLEAHRKLPHLCPGLGRPIRPRPIGV